MFLKATEHVPGHGYRSIGTIEVRKAQCPSCQGTGRGEVSAYNMGDDCETWYETCNNSKRKRSYSGNYENGCREGEVSFQTTESTCRACGGTKKIRFESDNGSFLPFIGKRQWTESCNTCLGSGKIVKHVSVSVCQDCDGKGKKESYKEVRGLFGWRTVLEKRWVCETCAGAGKLAHVGNERGYGN